MKLTAFKSSTLLVLSVLLMLGTPGLAIDYPTRPIHFIVSFAAGGPNDTIARLLGQYLSEQLGQPFVHPLVGREQDRAQNGPIARPPRDPVG